MSLLSSPRSLSSNSILCLAVDGQQGQMLMRQAVELENDSRLHGQPSIAGAAGHVGSWAFYPQLCDVQPALLLRELQSSMSWDKMHESSLFTSKPFLE
jgi:hypothetical protein